MVEESVCGGRQPLRSPLDPRAPLAAVLWGLLLGFVFFLPQLCWGYVECFLAPSLFGTFMAMRIWNPPQKKTREPPTVTKIVRVLAISIPFLAVRDRRCTGPAAVGAHVGGEVPGVVKPHGSLRHYRARVVPSVPQGAARAPCICARCGDFHRSLRGDGVLRRAAGGSSDCAGSEPLCGCARSSLDRFPWGLRRWPRAGADGNGSPLRARVGAPSCGAQRGRYQRGGCYRGSFGRVLYMDASLGGRLGSSYGAASPRSTRPQHPT